MKKLEKNLNSKRSLIANIRIAGATLAVIALLGACGGGSTETSTTNADSVKSSTMKKDTIAKQDTTKKVDVNTKKP